MVRALAAAASCSSKRCSLATTRYACLQQRSQQQQQQKHLHDQYRVRRHAPDLGRYDALPRFNLRRFRGAETARAAGLMLVVEIRRRRVQDVMSAWPTRIWNESFVSFFHFIYCSAWSRTIGQRKNEGADSSGCRAAHKIDRISACWCFMLRVASAACCSCMPRLLLLLLQVCPAAVRLWPSCK